MSPLTRLTLTPLTSRAGAVHSLRGVPMVTAMTARGGGRGISSTIKKDTGPVGATKSTLKKADRVVSDAAVKGIDKGERARDALKNTVGITNKEAKAKAENMTGEAAEYAGQGKGKAEEAIGYGKGKTQSAMGETKSRSTQSPSSAG